MTDDIDADAFFEAHEAEPSLEPEALRRAIDVYLTRMHLHVRRRHNDAPLTAEQAMEAFKPRDVTVEF